MQTRGDAPDGALSFKLSSWQVWILLWTVLFNTAALFFSAWLLTSTSSAMLRVESTWGKINGLDFYGWPLFHFTQGTQCLSKWLTIGFVASANHTLWALGILLFGALTVSIVRTRLQQPPPAPTPTIAGPAGYSVVPVPAFAMAASDPVGDPIDTKPADPS